MSPDTSGFSHLPRITTSLALTCGSDVSEVGDAVSSVRPGGRAGVFRRDAGEVTHCVLRPRPGGIQDSRAP